MQSCRNCLENKWSYKFVDGWVKAECQICGNEVEFKVKKERTEEELRNWNGPVAEYQIRNGKRFLKIDGTFQEVGLKKIGKSLQVVPIEKANL
jgi:DNA polymerase II large subunit